jgi:hypothetical protein
LWRCSYWEFKRRRLCLPSINQRWREKELFLEENWTDLPIT